MHQSRTMERARDRFRAIIAQRTVSAPAIQNNRQVAVGYENELLMQPSTSRQSQAVEEPTSTSSQTVKQSERVIKIPSKRLRQLQINAQRSLQEDIQDPRWDLPLAHNTALPSYQEYRSNIHQQELQKKYVRPYNAERNDSDSARLIPWIGCARARRFNKKPELQKFWKYDIEYRHAKAKLRCYKEKLEKRLHKKNVVPTDEEFKKLDKLDKKAEQTQATMIEEAENTSMSLDKQKQELEKEKCIRFDLLTPEEHAELRQQMSEDKKARQDIHKQSKQISHNRTAGGFKIFRLERILVENPVAAAAQMRVAMCPKVCSYEVTGFTEIEEVNWDSMWFSATSAVHDEPIDTAEMTDTDLGASEGPSSSIIRTSPSFSSMTGSHFGTDRTQEDDHQLSASPNQTGETFGSMSWLEKMELMMQKYDPHYRKHDIPTDLESAPVSFKRKLRRVKRQLAFAHLANEPVQTRERPLYLKRLYRTLPLSRISGGTIPCPVPNNSPERYCLPPEEQAEIKKEAAEDVSSEKIRLNTSLSLEKPPAGMKRRYWEAKQMLKEKRALEAMSKTVQEREPPSTAPLLPALPSFTTEQIIAGLKNLLFIQFGQLQQPTTLEGTKNRMDDETEPMRVPTPVLHPMTPSFEREKTPVAISAPNVQDAQVQKVETPVLQDQQETKEHFETYDTEDQKETVPVLRDLPEIEEQMNEEQYSSEMGYTYEKDQISYREPSPVPVKALPKPIYHVRDPKTQQLIPGEQALVVKTTSAGPVVVQQRNSPKSFVTQLKSPIPAQKVQQASISAEKRVETSRLEIPKLSASLKPPNMGKSPRSMPLAAFLAENPNLTPGYKEEKEAESPDVMKMLAARQSKILKKAKAAKAAAAVQDENKALKSPAPEEISPQAIKPEARFQEPLPVHRSPRMRRSGPVKILAPLTPAKKRKMQMTAEIMQGEPEIKITAERRKSDRRVQIQEPEPVNAPEVQRPPVVEIPMEIVPEVQIQMEIVPEAQIPLEIVPEVQIPMEIEPIAPRTARRASRRASKGQPETASPGPGKPKGRRQLQKERREALKKQAEEKEAINVATDLAAREMAASIIAIGTKKEAETRERHNRAVSASNSSGQSSPAESSTRAPAAGHSELMRLLTTKNPSSESRKMETRCKQKEIRPEPVLTRQPPSLEVIKIDSVDPSRASSVCEIASESSSIMSLPLKKRLLLQVQEERKEREMAEVQILSPPPVVEDPDEIIYVEIQPADIKREQEEAFLAEQVASAMPLHTDREYDEDGVDDPPLGYQIINAFDFPNIDKSFIDLDKYPFPPEAARVDGWCFKYLLKKLAKGKMRTVLPRHIDRTAAFPYTIADFICDPKLKFPLRYLQGDLLKMAQEDPVALFELAFTKLSTAAMEVLTFNRAKRQSTLVTSGKIKLLIPLYAEWREERLEDLALAVYNTTEGPKYEQLKTQFNKAMDKVQLAMCNNLLGLAKETTDSRWRPSDNVLKRRFETFLFGWRTYILRGGPLQVFSKDKDLPEEVQAALMRWLYRLGVLREEIAKDLIKGPAQRAYELVEAWEQKSGESAQWEASLLDVCSTASESHKYKCTNGCRDVYFSNEKLRDIHDAIHDFRRFECELDMVEFKHFLCYRLHFLERHIRDVVNDSLPFLNGSEEEFERLLARGEETFEDEYEDSDEEEAAEPA